MTSLDTGSEIDGFRLGDVMHVGSMATIYRLVGPERGAWRAFSFVLQRTRLHFQGWRSRFLSSSRDRRAVVQRTVGTPGLLLLLARGCRPRIYIASAEGVVVVLEAGDKLNILATNKLDGGILATPALVGGNIYVRTETHLYAFGT